MGTVPRGRNQAATQVQAATATRAAASRAVRCFRYASPRRAAAAASASSPAAVASGAPGAGQQPGIALRNPPASGGHRTGRSKSDSKLIQRLQEELAEGKGQCRRLALQAEAQQHKAQQATATKQQLLALKMRIIWQPIVRSFPFRERHRV